MLSFPRVPSDEMPEWNLDGLVLPASAGLSVLAHSSQQVHRHTVSHTVLQPPREAA
jgi:hypothetical protein